MQGVQFEDDDETVGGKGQQHKLGEHADEHAHWSPNMAPHLIDKKPSLKLILVPCLLFLVNNSGFCDEL